LDANDQMTFKISSPDFKGGAEKREIFLFHAGHILAQTQLMGIYSRNK
jgi:hypothetical protein